MSYDEGLAERLRNLFWERSDVEEKTMFGGLCFMVSDPMCFGIIEDKLMARVGPDNYRNCLNRKPASEMDFTGRAMKVMVFIAPQGMESDANLAEWVNPCLNFIEPLPPKKPKKL